jgi:hypothetical protein
VKKKNEFTRKLTKDTKGQETELFFVPFVSFVVQLPRIFALPSYSAHSADRRLKPARKATPLRG